MLGAKKLESLSNCLSKQACFSLTPCV